MNVYAKSHGEFAVGQPVTVTLRGTICDIRVDPDGPKLNLRGKGFFIWVAPEETGVDVNTKEAT